MNMNVHLRSLVFLLSLLFSGGLLGQASIVPIDLDTYRNTPLEYAFTSSPAPASIVVDPTHGEAILVSTAPFQYTLTYTPDEDFIGQDYMEVYFFQGTLKKYTISLDVIPAAVEAFHDYAATMINTAVDIPVIANDFSSNGIYELLAVPAVNNGTATYDMAAGVLTFIPDANFVGLTHLNYAICNGAGVCDNGTVSITVMPTEEEQNEEVTIFTKKNLAQVVLIPHEFTLTSGPANGVFDNSGITPTYTPNVDFVGDDTLVFEYGDQTTTVTIRVLDLVENVFLFNDEVFTTGAEAAEFNVLDNDLYGTDTGCMGYGTPQYGTLLHSGNTPGMAKGDVIYIPDAGFEGTDWFTYQGHSGATCGSPEETAKVFIHVSDFAPSASSFDMSTPKLTPLLIGYDLPVTSYEFSITDQGELGEVLYMPGDVDVEIYGKQITGYNLLIYVPNEDVTSGLDEFEIEYCALDVAGNCALSRTVKVYMEILDIGTGNEPLCFDDCVWAGDTNFDGVVDVKDLLPIGVSMGEVGSLRPNSDMTAWYGQYADDWNGPFNDEIVDLKHIDADGDAIVTALDTGAINQFYGRTHALVPAVTPYYEHEIVLEGSIFAEPGDYVQLPMILGGETNPAVDIYGFTFPFEYNPLFFEPESMNISFEGDSWLGYNSPILHMQNNDYDGKVEAAFTRTSGVSATGYGRIGMVEFVIDEDLAGFRLEDGPIQVAIAGQTSTATNSQGHLSGIHIGGTIITIVAPGYDKTPEQLLNPDLMKVYPNISSDIVNVHLNGSQTFSDVMVRDIMGQMVYTKKVNDNHTSIDVNTLSEGMYIVSIRTDAGVMTKRFEVVR